MWVATKGVIRDTPKGRKRNMGRQSDSLIVRSIINNGSEKEIGYIIQNIGNVPIKYDVEQWKLSYGDKSIERHKITKLMIPGEIAVLNKKNMVLFCARKSISFNLKNGQLINGGKGRSHNLKSLLKQYYFQMDSEDYLGIQTEEIELAELFNKDNKIRCKAIKIFGAKE